MKDFNQKLRLKDIEKSRNNQDFSRYKVITLYHLYQRIVIERYD